MSVKHLCFTAGVERRSYLGKAEREGVSRQAVRDAIIKATDNLEGYEAKLKLMERRMALMNGLKELQNICHDPAVKAKIRALTEICEDGI